MKQFKTLVALVLALALTLTLVGAALADTTTPHTITVTTNGDGTHTYGAYQIFVGNLDATGEKLSNVAWGSAMTTEKVTALKNALASDSTFGTCDTAQDFADKLNGVADNAAVARTFADAVNTALGDAAATASATTSNKVASISVTGDGYYFIKDTGTIANTDTATRFMLQVVGNISVTAKDTVLTPDKEIVNEDGTAVTATKDNDASIGDVITYNVTIPVPNTSEYKNHFVLQMNDTLEAGLTYFGNMSITINTDPVTTLTSGTDYTPVVKTGNADFTVPSTANAAVTTAGGQTIQVTFKDFKAKAEANNNAWFGKTITISYQVVLNDDATYGVDSNDNTVYFKYSNNPNYNYDGDNPGPEEVTGKTPNSTTKTFVTKLELDKVDGADNSALAGAEFKLTGTSWNNVLATGEKFEEAPYTAKDGETVLDGTYYKLNDGSYTTVPKNNQTAAQYETGDKTYKKVTFANVVKTAKNVDLTLITDESGHIIIKGIEQGTYTLQETKAPTGYNLDSTTHTLVIDWSNPDADGASSALVAAGGFSKGTGSDNNFEMDADGARFHITIENNAGSTLPSTGGIGTTIFYVAGIVLVLGAAAVIIARRKAEQE